MDFPLCRTLGLASLLGLSVLPATGAAAPNECPSLLRHQFPALQGGKMMDLCQYRGKVVLVVNTASYCGFTTQYDGLEKLYARLKSRGLVVLGFPSNDFGAQEPGSDKEIADFCRLTYGVEFPMVAKTHVVGAQANPFHVQLAELTGSRPKWNFHKYLINRDASRVLAFSSLTAPDDKALLSRIEEFLQ